MTSFWCSLCWGGGGCLCKIVQLLPTNSNGDRLSGESRCHSQAIIGPDPFSFSTSAPVISITLKSWWGGGGVAFKTPLISMRALGSNLRFCFDDSSLFFLKPIRAPNFTRRTSCTRWNVKKDLIHSPWTPPGCWACAPSTCNTTLSDNCCQTGNVTFWKVSGNQKLTKELFCSVQTGTGGFNCVKNEPFSDQNQTKWTHFPCWITVNHLHFNKERFQEWK